MRKRLVRAINSLLALTVLYLVLSAIFPVNVAEQHLYHLSNVGYHVLQFVIAIPLIAFWFAAFYGYAKLKQYADSLKNADEAMGYHLLARGCMLLAWGKPVLAILGEILNAITAHHPNFNPSATIIINYANIIILIIAFSIIGNGSRKLLEQAKGSLTALAAKLLVLTFVVIGVIYCFILFRPVDLNSMTLSRGPYFLPVWLIISTVTIPSLYAWFIGLLSVGEIFRYSQITHGLLYRQAVKLISVGIITVIASAIAFLYVSSIDPSLTQMSLDLNLISNYLIRIIGALGFMAIAVGAIRLKRIEDV